MTKLIVRYYDGNVNVIIIDETTCLHQIIDNIKNECRLHKIPEPDFDFDCWETN